MKINITKNQYRTLIKILFLGVYMTNGIRNPDETIKEFDDIEQFFYSFFKEFHCEDIIEKEDDHYFPTQSLENEMFEYIRDFEDDCFWDEIILRLGRKNFIKSIGEKAFNTMDIEERITKEQPFLDKYYNEISKNGLKNIDIL